MEYIDCQFYEIQKFSRVNLLTLLIIIGTIFYFVFFESLNDFIIATTSLVGLIVFLGSIKLETIITEEGITFFYFPFIKRTLSWLKIIDAKIIDYHFYGSSLTTNYYAKYGTIFSLKNSKGLAVILKNGEKLIIATQKPEEMETFITNLNKESMRKIMALLGDDVNNTNKI